MTVIGLIGGIAPESTVAYFEDLVPSPVPLLDTTAIQVAALRHRAAQA